LDEKRMGRVGRGLGKEDHYYYFISMIEFQPKGLHFLVNCHSLLTFFVDALCNVHI